MQPAFRTRILFYQSKATFDVKILPGKITYHLQTRKILVRFLYGNESSTCDSGP